MVKCGEMNRYEKAAEKETKKMQGKGPNKDCKRQRTTYQTSKSPSTTTHTGTMVNINKHEDQETLLGIMP